MPSKKNIKRPFNGLQNSLQRPLKGKGLFKPFSNLSKGRLLVTCERSKGLVKPVERPSEGLYKICAKLFEDLLTPGTREIR